MNWNGGWGDLNGSFTDGFTDGYKINYYFNLFRRYIFEFRTKIFNDPPYFSWSVGNFVGELMRSEMHLMHNLLEFARSVSNGIGKIELSSPSSQSSIWISSSSSTFACPLELKTTFNSSASTSMLLLNFGPHMLETVYTSFKQSVGV